jgi:predicted  nucleic acid-binding Zn-ribbon protein
MLHRTERSPVQTKIMSYELNKQLADIETSIRDAILSGDNFQYQKLLRMKAENLDSQFFAETKNLKSDIENLQSERSFGLSVLADLNDELRQAADVVLLRRNALYEAEMSYQGVQAKQFYLTTQTEQQRKDIRELKSKLNSHVNSKLNSGDSPTMETLTNETIFS